MVKEVLKAVARGDGNAEVVVTYQGSDAQWNENSR